MRKRDRIACAHAKIALPAEVVERSRDDLEADPVQLAKQRCNMARERSVDEGLEEDRLGAVLALVHRDQLAEDDVG